MKDGSNDMENNERRQILKDWEYKFLLILIILMVILTIIDLDLTLDQVLKFFIR
ncbi:MAG: hypothetical protein ACOCZR_00275 [Halanaerobiales bacterium]